LWNKKSTWTTLIRSNVRAFFLILTFDCQHDTSLNIKFQKVWIWINLTFCACFEKLALGWARKFDGKCSKEFLLFHHKFNWFLIKFSSFHFNYFLYFFIKFSWNKRNCLFSVYAHTHTYTIFFISSDECFYALVPW
jgi:hypothetical protein